MKKSILVLLSAFMLLTSMVFSIAADYEPVASIGETTYSTLEAAFDAVKASNDDVTITLLNDLTLTDKLIVELNGNGEVKLDLNKKTLSGRVNLVKGKLTVDNGTIAGGSNQALNVYGSSTEASDYSVLTVEKGAVVTADVYGVCLFGNAYNSDGYGAKINIYGNVSTNGDGQNGAVFVSGNLGKGKDVSQNNIINIYDDAVISSKTDAAIALNGNAEVFVYKATITGNTAIAVKRGTLNVDGATVKATGEKIDPADPYYNGTEMTGAAISVTDTYIGNGPISVRITGGDITSEKGYSVYKEDADYKGKLTIKVNGGSYSDLECLKYIDKESTGTVKVSLNDSVNNARGIAVPEGTNVEVDFNDYDYVITGPGDGSSGTKTNGFQFLAKGTVPTSNITFKNGTISLAEANKTNKLADRAIRHVIQNYANLTLDNMEIDATYANTEKVPYAVSNNSGNSKFIDTKITASSGNFAFDSCDYGYDLPTVTVSGNSEIKGKVEATGGDINFEDGSKLIGQLRIGENKQGGATGSVVTVKEGATISNQGNWAAAIFGENTLNLYGKAEGVVGSNGNDFNAKSKLNVYDGAEIISTDAAIYWPNGDLNIEGGTITGKTAVYFKSTNLNITGGTLIGNGEKAEYKFNNNGCNETGDALVIDNCKYPSGIDSVSVSGGNFKSENAKPIASYVGNGQTEIIKGFVTGGNFDDIDDELVANGYRVIKSTVDGYAKTVEQFADVDTDIVVEEETKNSISKEISKNDEEIISKELEKIYSENLFESIKGEELEEIIKNGINNAELDTTKELIVDVYVSVEASKSSLSGTADDQKTITFTVKPYVVITDGIKKTDPILVGNDALSNKAKISITLPTCGITPVEVVHEKDNGVKEYFYATGNKKFTLNENNTVTIELSDFSTVSINAKITKTENRKYWPKPRFNPASSNTKPSTKTYVAPVTGIE